MKNSIYLLIALILTSIAKSQNNMNKHFITIFHVRRPLQDSHMGLLANSGFVLDFSGIC